MASKLRFDFPAEVVQKRKRLMEQVRTLLAQQTLEGVREAKRLLLDWLREYPNDYTALDAGEVIAMSESAYEREEEIVAKAF